MPLPHVLLVIITAGATGSDLLKYRISNRFFVFCTLAASLLLVLSGERPSWPDLLGNVFFPFILLYIPGCLRIIGAGDIKLFCLISVFLGRRAAAKIIWVSFLAGGVEALFLMLLRRNLTGRIRYFLTYLNHTLEEKKILPYMEQRDGKAVFHFTVPILLAVLMYLGGVYQ